MRYGRFLSGLVLAAVSRGAFAQVPKSFTLQQVLSAPFANELTAAPVGGLFAWVENAEGRHNLYVGGKDISARALTHNTQDDGQDISQLAWAPDGSAIAYVYGAPNGADGKPADPAHMGVGANKVILQALAPDAKPVEIGEGRSPLFFRNSCGVLFLRGGKIWVHGLKDEPKPSSIVPLHEDPNLGRTNGLPDPLECDRSGGAYPLVPDRGSASQLMLSPDGNLLAYISRRSEANEPAHSYLAIYDLLAMGLTFPSPSTGNDLSPAFSPDGSQLTWLRVPFTETPEFALDRTSANPWSIQLLKLKPCAPKAICRFIPETETPSVLEGATLPAGSRTLFTPEANKRGSVLPHMATGNPPLLFVDEHHIVFASEASGWVHLYSVNPVGGMPPYLLNRADAGDIEDVFVDGNRVLFSSNDDGYDPLDRDRRHIMSYVLSDAEELGVEQGTSGASIETSPIVADGRTAALVSDAKMPMHPAIVMPPHGAGRATLTALHFGAVPKEYPLAALTVPQQVLFDSTDNLHLHGQLFLPKQDADSSAALRKDKEVSGGGNAATIKHPAILFFHGGPRRQMLLGYPAMEYYSNAYAMNQYLASRGFIVLSVNYRCGIGYGLDFRQCDHEGATGAKEYDDVLAAQKYLASRPDVDPKRIGIWGGSYGGYLTALALSRNSDLFAAGVDFHGVHDWNLEDNAFDWKRGSFERQDAIGAEALASSPLADLSRWRSPILLIHGDNDPSVAYAQTPLMADALRTRNASLPKEQQVDVEELIFPDELHEFMLHKDWLAAYTATAAFFERTLKP